MSRAHQFRLLLWKNFVLQKRHKFVTAFEFVLPIALTLLLVFIRKIAPYDEFEDPFVYTDFSVDRLPSTMPKRQILQQLSLLFGSLAGGKRALPVVYSPNTSHTVNSVMETVAHKLGYSHTGVGFKTEEELEHFTMYGTMDILAGIVFPNLLPNDTFPKDIQYKIRMKVKSNGSATPLLMDDTWYTEQAYPTYQMPGPRELFSNEGGRPGYYASGFLALQHAIALSIIELITGQRVPDVKVKMRRFPYPPFTDDKFLTALQEWLPMVLLISFLYPAVNLVKNLVHEKENKIKESMKMMGLSGWLHWSAWFVKTFLFLLPNSAIIILLLCSPTNHGMAVLTNSDYTVVFFFFIVFNITSICFCNLISTWFSRASSAATAAGFFWFVSFVPFFFMAPRYDSLAHQSKIMACLLSNSAMALGAQLITMFEGTGEGIQWSNLFVSVTPGDRLTLGTVLWMLIFDAIVYSLLTWYIEGVCPGEFGVPKPWYFPFTKEYWSDTLASDEVSPEVLPMTNYKNTEFFEKDPQGQVAGIQIKDLSKVYGKQKVAVNQMNLNMFEGQVTVLLGHNGAGKTTTMSMLTGLIPPSHGTAVISGYDCRNNLDAIRKNLGLCPQHDVLFDDLTVSEHLYFFCKLKGGSNKLVQTETDRLLKALQLDDKRHSLAGMLSGGMKRKLSVAIALCAGSKVVMLDEPTSGMDPSARRNTWDLLQVERQKRTILLTTHFMDEADLLGDRIAIMAHGQLQCSGSPLFLKKKYGAGYHMIIVKQPHCKTEKITDLVLQHLPTAELESNIGAELSYILPHEGSSKFESLFTILEKSKDSLGISSYGASVTTMEEVFLRVGESNSGEGLRSMLQSNGASKFIDVDVTSPSSNIIMEGATETLLRQPVQLNEGFYLYCQQFWAMLLKRILYTQRNWILTLSQFFVPVIFVTIAMSVARTLPSNDNPKPLKIGLDLFSDSIIPYYVSKAAEADPATLRLSKYFRNQFHGENYPVDVANMIQYKNISDYLLQKSYEDLPHFNLHQIAAVSFLRNTETKKTTVVAHFNNQPYHGPTISLNLVDTALLQHSTNDSGYKFSVINHPFTLSVSDTMLAVYAGNLGFNIAFNLVFGVAFLISSFVIFLIKENNCKSRHLQFVSGAHFLIYWSTTLIWDFLNFVVSCYMILLVLVAFNQEGYTDAKQQGRFMLLFVLYAWSNLPLMYLMSFCFKVPSTGFTRLMMFNILSGLATLLTVTILYIPALDAVDWAETLDWVFLVLPSYCLGWACYDLYKNYHINRMCSFPMVKPFCELAKITKNCGNYPCPEYQENFLSWNRPGIGRMMVMLLLQGFLFWIIIFLMEMQAFRKGRQFLRSFITRFLQRSSRKVYVKLNQDPLLEHSDQELGMLDAADGDVDLEDERSVEDDDVAHERDRIETTTLGGLVPTDNLVLRDVTKYYGDFLAVDHLTVGIPRGECFGLLGVNGAGKTTTFKMMTGDEVLSDGDAFVEGFSVSKHMKQVQQRIGYCPQFDALIDQMSGRETLYMFARLHGVCENQIGRLVNSLSDNLLLNEHLDKLVKEYSGGNRRKLSTAISLVGSPPIVFLDEPTTGMDPLARRLLWDSISRVRDMGHSIILTSHSMEECDVLCTRLAIMVNGRFRCLGSPQHLKNKFGQGYTLIAKVKRLDEGSQNKATEASLQRLRNFVEMSFPGSILKDTHHSMVHYHIQNPKLSWAYIFGTMEKAKDEFQIEDYSVSQTTLEQVFLNFARAQRATDVT